MSFLRRPTAFSGGIAAGGGDTGWPITPQLTTFFLQVSDAAKTAVLPVGTTIFEKICRPDPDAPSSGGTVTLADTTNSVTHLSGVAAQTPTKAAVSTVTLLTADATITATPSSLDAGTSVWVGFVVMLPRRA